MMQSLEALLRRELKIAARQGTATLLVVAFFLITTTLFPLGIGPEPVLLARIAPGVLWVVALLSVFLSLDRLFQGDYEDGTLDALLFGPAPLEFIVLTKIFAHWLTSSVPLLIVAPVLARFLNIPVDGLGVLLLALTLGTPILCLIGAIGSALALSIRRGGALLSLLILPLYIPTLIFGTAAVDAAISGLPVMPHLIVLLAMLIPAIVLAPVAAAAAIRAAI